MVGRPTKLAIKLNEYDVNFVPSIYENQGTGSSRFHRRANPKARIEVEDLVEIFCRWISE